MAQGKKTGGRAKGVPNKATIKRQAEIAASGLTPLDYMLEVMRDDEAPLYRRDDMAKAAAPYVHPKLAAMTHTGEDGGPFKTDSTHHVALTVSDSAAFVAAALGSRAAATSEEPGEI